MTMWIVCVLCVWKYYYYYYWILINWPKTNIGMKILMVMWILVMTININEDEES